MHFQDLASGGRHLAPLDFGVSTCIVRNCGGDVYKVRPMQERAAAAHIAAARCVPLGLWVGWLGLFMVSEACSCCCWRQMGYCQEHFANHERDLVDSIQNELCGEDNPYNQTYRESLSCTEMSLLLTGRLIMTRAVAERDEQHDGLTAPATAGLCGEAA